MEILNGERATTGDTALRLAHFFGTSAQFWLNLQSIYDLRLAGRKAGRAMKKKSKRIQVEAGSGNVFRDLGFPNAERERLKADLTLQIFRFIKARDLTQTKAGEILGIKQPHVSALMRGHSGAFSVERLMRFLTALGQDGESPCDPRASGRSKGECLSSCVDAVARKL